MPEQRALVRYMGTKRSLAQVVRDEILAIPRNGMVADLFSGMGAVAEALAPAVPVWLNDALTFPSVFARARFTAGGRRAHLEALRSLVDPYLTAHAALTQHFADRLSEESSALASRQALLEYFESSNHVGNSDFMARAAVAACSATGADHYQLATLYFSGGYFSSRQSIQIDALRYAIDQQPQVDQDWLIASWISAISVLINSPGHTAQFLKPTSDAAFMRIRTRWRRDVWTEFAERLPLVTQLGESEWRSRNRVTTGDALDALTEMHSAEIRAIYADPPYTKDHYSRYYHVYETLYLYDYPSSEGTGRYRAHRYSSPFSLATQVVSAFERLLGSVRDLGVPLVLSYPAAGLLATQAVPEDLVRAYLPVKKILNRQTLHSTLGASHGPTSKAAVERIYVCST